MKQYPEVEVIAMVKHPGVEQEEITLVPKIPKAWIISSGDIISTPTSILP
ncbi:hypothetical protein M1N58_02340 [Dehalococcoidales bacterium]|nr:hypothetical protein [Dehalococcoidales bacterium]MCL0094718.1 hypothetical protein [Dehalococcoidales bacterium]